MPQVALNWDSHRIRLAVASGGKAGVGRVRFDRAVTVLLGDSRDDEGRTGELSTSRLADKLSAILERYGVSRGEATVVVARSDVEMRELVLPPVPEEELPDLVRFQARSHFTSFNDDWLLDYIRIATSDQGCTVLAMAISPEQARKIRETVELAGLRLRHIVLRPFAAAELVRSHHPGTECRVILEPLWRQADISIVRNDFVVLTRTVRVPDTYSDEQFDAWLPDEIRRTIAAASNQTAAEDVTGIVVCGGQAQHRKLSDELGGKFNIPATFFDPFDAVSTGIEFEKPDRIDGFASLLGSIVQSTSGENHAVDFLNPRRVVQPELDKRKIAIGGGVAAGILVFLLAWLWWTFSSRDAEIDRLVRSNNQLSRQVEEIEQQANRVAVIDRWRSGGVNWLEELYQLSLLYPDPDESRLNQLVAAVNVNDASFTAKGVMRDQATLDVTNSRLMDGHYKNVDVTRKAPSSSSDFALIIDHAILLPLFDVETVGKPPLAAASDIPTEPADTAPDESPASPPRQQP